MDSSSTTMISSSEFETDDAKDGTVARTEDGAARLRFESETRTVVCGDAIAWLNSYEDNGLPEGYFGFTSLPDITELIRLFKTETAEYKKWFTDAAALFMSKLSVGSFVVFLQSDVRYLSTNGEVGEWIDKSYLCSVAAERTGCVLMWHKLVRTLEGCVFFWFAASIALTFACFVQVSTDKNSNKKSTGRPTYSHLVCYGKNGYVNRPVEVQVSRNKRKKELRAEAERVKAAEKDKEKEYQRQQKHHEGGGIGERDDVAIALTSVAVGIAENELAGVMAGASLDPPSRSNGETITSVAPTLSVEQEEKEEDAATPPQLSYWRCSYRTSLFAVPDIFYRGEMLWPKGIGLDCCFVGVMFLKTVVQAKGIIDPFAGQVIVMHVWV